MLSTRREILRALAGYGALAATSACARRVSGQEVLLPSSPSAEVKMVVFDGFPIFDPRPVLATVKTIGGPKGPELASLFRTRLFEYQWLRALSGQYRDFLNVASDALLFAGEQQKINIAPNDVAKLHHALTHLKVWPDTVDAVHRLKASRLKLALLSNMTPGMLQTGLQNSGIEKEFDHVLSTDSIATFKPAPRAYAMATEASGLQRNQILFVAFAGWDASGANWHGYPTYWVNRLGAPAERLQVTTVGSSRDLTGLVEYVDSLLG